MLKSVSPTGCTATILALFESPDCFRFQHRSYHSGYSSEIRKAQSQHISLRSQVIHRKNLEFVTQVH
jgi:hypothetical protein